MTALERAKAQGYDVRIRHQRRWTYTPTVKGKTLHLQTPVVCNNGGETFVRLYKDGKVWNGISVCVPDDNYCKRDGVKYAIRHALRQEPQTVGD
jgi:hypothetical protein